MSNPIRYRIDLSGSRTASCPELELSVTRGRHCVIDVLARQMIKAGADPERPVEIFRGATRVFRGAAPLKAWADRRLYEKDARGFETTRYVADTRFEETK